MNIKSKQEIKKITEAGRLMGEILETLAKSVRPGVSAWDTDVEAERMIREVGGVPAFKGYRTRKSDVPFPATICASLNEEIVHAIPTKEKILKNGDIFSIDIGMQWPANCGEGKDGNGFFIDTALTLPVGVISKELTELLMRTRRSLDIGIEAARPGNSIADIGRAVEGFIKPFGYGIVRDLVGHGVGHAVHEDPRIPNYYEKSLEAWKIEPGMVIAIEPMITLGSHEIETLEDGWGIVTRDGSLSAHFEHTIVITEDGPIVVTKRPGEKI